MTYDAVLLDLYDTLVWSDWYSWQGRLADHLGVTHETIGRAFNETRPARSVGTTPTPRPTSSRCSRRPTSSPRPC